MIPIKTKKEIEVMRQGGEKLSQVLDYVASNLKPGITTAQLDKLAEEKILAAGGKPSFKIVPGYQWTSCITVNDEVVHGIPGEKIIKEGDIVGIDTGMYYKGFHTDLAWTIEVQKARGKGQSDNKKFLEAGENALKKAIQEVRPGNKIADISRAIQEEIKKGGFSPVRELTGHGIGRKLHEEPPIPCFFERKNNPKKTPLLKEGMTLAIEVIYNWGLADVFMADDGWTIKTKDGKISGLFEKTVAVTANGPLILTQLGQC